MDKRKHSRRHPLRAICIFILLLLVAASAGIYVYTADYYHAGETAISISQSEELKEYAHWLELTAESDKDEMTGLIFYPGAKVEYTAYLPLLKKLQAEGIHCFLVEMPLNLAFLGKNRAEDIITAHPEIDAWYMAGHSLGGAFASAFASDHSDEIEGVILLGAYLYGTYPVEKSLTIYGSEDLVLNREKITYDTNVYVIEGGNHAQFGDYGVQKKDGTAKVSAEEQIEETVTLMTDFIVGTSGSLGQAEASVSATNSLE